jgi:hypothetical protein
MTDPTTNTGQTSPHAFDRLRHDGHGETLTRRQKKVRGLIPDASVTIEILTSFRERGDGAGNNDCLVGGTSHV